MPALAELAPEEAARRTDRHGPLPQYSKTAPPLPSTAPFSRARTAARGSGCGSRVRRSRRRGEGRRRGDRGARARSTSQPRRSARLGKLPENVPAHGTRGPMREMRPSVRKVARIMIHTDDTSRSAFDDEVVRRAHPCPSRCRGRLHPAHVLDEEVVVAREAVLRVHAVLVLDRGEVELAVRHRRTSRAALSWRGAGRGRSERPRARTAKSGRQIHSGMTSRNGRRGSGVLLRGHAAGRSRAHRPRRSTKPARSAAHSRGSSRSSAYRSAVARPPLEDREPTTRLDRDRPSARPSASSTSTSQPFDTVLDELRRLADAGRRRAEPRRPSTPARPSAPLLACGNDVDVDAWYAAASSARLRRDVAVRDPSTLELAADVAAGRPGEQDEELRDRRRMRRSAATSTSGPLISFGSRPSPQPTPSFWNEPTTNAPSGSSSAPRATVRALGVDEREVLDVDPDRDHVDRARIHPCLEHEVAHLGVRHLDPREPCGRRAERLRTRGRTPDSPVVPGRPCR